MYVFRYMEYWYQYYEIIIKIIKIQVIDFIDFLIGLQIFYGVLNYGKYILFDVKNLRCFIVSWIQRFNMIVLERKFQ